MNHPVIQSATYQDRQFQWHPSEVVPQCGAANMPVRDLERQPPTQGESSLGLAKLKSGEQGCEKPRDVHLAKSTQAARNLSGTCSPTCRASTSSLDDETVLQSAAGNGETMIKSSDSSAKVSDQAHETSSTHHHYLQPQKRVITRSFSCSLESGACVAEQDRYQRTASYWAARGGHIQATGELLPRSTIVDNHNRYGSHRSAKPRIELACYEDLNCSACMGLMFIACLALMSLAHQGVRILPSSTQTIDVDKILPRRSKNVSNPSSVSLIIKYRGLRRCLYEGIL
jgi:hypothetical protein